MNSGRVGEGLRVTAQWENTAVPLGNLVSISRTIPVGPFANEDALAPAAGANRDNGSELGVSIREARNLDHELINVAHLLAVDFFWLGDLSAVGAAKSPRLKVLLEALEKNCVWIGEGGHIALFKRSRSGLPPVCPKEVAARLD